MDDEDLKPIITRDLQIVDGSGRRRVWISTEMYCGNPVFTMYDEKGLERVSIHIDESQAASIAVLDANGHPVIGIGQSADGRIGIQFSTSDGTPGFVFTIQPDGQREMAVVDKAGKTIWRTPE
jgi:hypothetical protein